MKKLFVAALMLVGTLGAFAQKIEVKESNEVVGGGSHNALVVTIYESNKSDVIKAWKSDMKDYDAKVKTNKNGGFADNALIKSLCENFIDVHFTASEEGNNTVKLVVAFDLGGAYLSSNMHGDKYHTAKAIVESFARKLTKQGLEGIVSLEEEKQKDIEKEKDKLIKEKNSLQKTIADAKALIEKSENEIKENEKNQEKNKVALEKQVAALKLAKKRASNF